VIERQAAGQANKEQPKIFYYSNTLGEGVKLIKLKAQLLTDNPSNSELTRELLDLSGSVLASYGILAHRVKRETLKSMVIKEPKK
jgi:hypothetical protein